MIRILILSILLPVFSFDVCGQAMSENDLIGKWNVINVITIKVPKSKTAEVEKQKNAFLNAAFKFQPNKFFTLSVENESEDPEIEKMEIYGAHWKLEKNPAIVFIEKWSDKDSDKFDLMEIKIKQEEGKVFFLISDTYFKLEMKKED